MFRLALVVCSIFVFSTSQPVKAQDTAVRIKVVSDPSAIYHLLSVSKLANGNLQVMTRRDGRSGTSYSRREVNCGAMTFRYLGEGDSLAQTLRNSPSRGRMTEAMPTSISGEVSRFGCRRSGRN